MQNEYTKPNVALITVIESDEVNIDSANTGFVRYFEREAIRAFSYWRANGGSLRDIDIYAVCITKNTISSQTKKAFNNLNVTYIESYHDITDTFDCGFFNKPLGCSFLERKLPHDYLIHIDLDMYLLKEPDIEWKNSCMVYDSKQAAEERVHLDNSIPEPFNTCYMITRREDFIFSKWWDLLRGLSLLYDYDPYYFQRRYGNLEYRKLEELSFDLLSKHVDIHRIPNMLIGETYTDFSDMTSEEQSRVSFHHFHIYECYSDYSWLEEWKEWKDSQ